MNHSALPFAAKKFQSLTLVTAGWALLVIFVGAVVQVTNVGQDCPTWFLCYGQAAPPSQVAVGLAFVHHLTVSLAALLSIATAIVARDDSRHASLIARLNLRAIVAAFFLIFSIIVVIWTAYHPLARVGYLLIALIYFGMTLALTVAARLPTGQTITVNLAPHRFYTRLLLVAAGSLLFITLNGVLVTGTGARSACFDWPLCTAELLPLTAVEPMVIINLFHRFAVILVGIIIAAVVLQTFRRYAREPQLVRWASTLGLLFLAQIGVGGWTVLLPLPRVIVNAAHLALTAAIWGSLVVLGAMFVWRSSSLPVGFNNTQPAVKLPPRQKAKVYFKLTKPWIMVLLLITTIGAMVIAAKGLPSLSLLFFTTIGGALAAGGASVLNSYVDSDIDHLMARTSRRATVTGLVTPQETLLFGLILSTLSFFVYALFVNTLSAVLSTLGILYYVFFYTLYLKRKTIHNIIIGGAAGAIPPLVGWTAVTGLLDLGAFYLFAIIFFWTPPHTWALALLVKKDYAQARVPMLPVVVGEKETTYQILLYSILLVTLTLLPFTFSMLSLIYLIAAIALGLPFIYLAWKLWRNFEKSSSKRLYKFSQLYLALLFIIMAVDRTLFV